MRHLILISILTLSIPGCLIGASRGQTTTTFVDDPGNGPVRRQTYKTESSGMYVGGNMPLMNGGGIYADGMNGFGATMVNGSSGTACILHADRCAVAQTVVVIQPISISSSGGGYVAGGRGESSEANERHDAELSALLAKHEKQLSEVRDVERTLVLENCRSKIANPESIPADYRAAEIKNCQGFLAKRPHKK